MKKTLFVIICLLAAISTVRPQSASIAPLDGVNNKMCIPIENNRFEYRLNAGLNKTTVVTWTLSAGSGVFSNNQDTITTTNSNHIVYVSWFNPTADASNIMPQWKIEAKWTQNGSWEAEATITILSVQNYQPSYVKIDGKTDGVVPYNKASVTLETEAMKYQHTDIAINNYEWVLPDGWVTGEGHSGTVYSRGHALTVIPTACGGDGAKIKVRPISHCNMQYVLTGGRYQEITVRRGMPNITVTTNPASIIPETETPVTFTVNGAGNLSEYNWSVPSCYSNSGNFTTITNSLTRTNNGTCYSAVTVSMNICNNNISIQKAINPDPSLLTVPQSFNATGGGIATLINPGNTPISWSVSPEDKFMLINPTNTSVTVQKKSTEAVSGNITATFQGGGVIDKDFSSPAWNLAISGPDIVCSSGAEFTINNLPEGIAQVTWSCNSLSLQPVGGSTGYPKTFRALIDASGRFNWISATVNIDGTDNTLPQIYVTAGSPAGSIFAYDPAINASVASITANKNYRFDAVNVPSDVAPFAIRWIVTKYPQQRDDFPEWYQGRNILLRFPESYTSVKIEMRYQGVCGYSPYVTKYYVIYPSQGQYSLAYPNPASDILTIEIDAEAIAQAKAMEQTTTSAKQLKTGPTYDIRLYDGQGNLLRRTTTKGGSVQFNVANLTKGVYYLHVYDGSGGTPEMQQIVVER